MASQRGCRVFATVSGKGGTGKSTVACMLGTAFARCGHSTLLIDADEGLRCLDLMLGVSEGVVYDLGDLLRGGCEAKDAIRPVPNISGLYLLPAPFSAGGVSERLGELVEKLRGVFDRIIIDSTAGIGPVFSTVSACADEVIAVVGSDPVSIRDARNVCELLRDVSEAKRRLIINRFYYHDLRSGLAPQIDSIIDSTAIRLVGIVPFDEAVQLAAMRGEVAQKGGAWRAFVRIAHRLDGKNVNLPKLKKIKA